jgi:hypothetical protein
LPRGLVTMVNALESKAASANRSPLSFCVTASALIELGIGKCCQLDLFSSKTKNVVSVLAQSQGSVLPRETAAVYLQLGATSDQCPVGLQVAG